MALATYSDLQAAVANFLHRGDLGSKIPDYVVLAEAEMNRVITARRQIGRATATLTTEYVPVPSDFSGVRTFRLTDGDQATLAYVPPEVMADWKGACPQAGTPAYYTVVGDAFELHPAPNGSYGALIAYSRSIPPLASNSTNWLLGAYPDVYLKGTLKYAFIDLRDDERATLADQQFQAAMAAVNDQSLAETLPGALAPAPRFVP